VDVGGLLAVIAGLIAYVAIGYVLRRSGLLAAEDARPLNSLLVYVALPALIFGTVHDATLDWSFAALPAIAWVVVVAGLAVSFAITRVLKLDGPRTGAFMLVAVFGNTAYMGYPVATALLGDAGLVRAIISDIFGNTIAIISLGTFVVSRFGEHGFKVNPLREVLTFPPFIALAAALLLHSVTIPAGLSAWLDALGTLVVPMIMISVGLTLKPAALGGHLRPALLVAALKLVALPLLAWGLALLVLDDPASVRIAVLEAGVPSMMFTLIMGARLKLDVDFIASAILVTLMGAVVTIPLFQLLVG
jgi:predicted permease